MDDKDRIPWEQQWQSNIKPDKAKIDRYIKQAKTRKPLKQTASIAELVKARLFELKQIAEQKKEQQEAKK